MKKDICVIGIGRYGLSVVEELVKLQNVVLAVDSNENSLNPIAEIASNVAIADAADIKALQGLGIQHFNTVIVGMSDNIEVVAALLELNIPNIIARANSKRHARVLKQIGVDVIIRPEEEAGVRTALIANNQSFIKNSENLQDIGDNYVIGTIQVSNPKLFNLAIKDSPFAKQNVNIVLLKRNATSILPSGDLEIKQGDYLTLIGKIQYVTSAFKFITFNKDEIDFKQNVIKSSELFSKDKE